MIGRGLPGQFEFARRHASTSPEEPPVHQLRKLILKGELSSILAVLNSARLSIGKPEVRDILCRIGDADEAEDLGKPEVRKELLGALVEVAKDLGLSKPDANLIARAAARVPWDFETIKNFLATARESGVKPTAEMYEQFMKSLLRTLDSSGAEQLLLEMEIDGIRGNTAIYGQLSECFVAVGRKEALDRLLGTKK
jgi:hypothetical protein